MKQSELLELLVRVELARRNFWYFCKLRLPNFYKDERIYLKDLCDTLQRFWESDEDILIVNMPPRHGKSLTLTLFTQWILKDVSKKVMTASYNSTLSTDFSKQVRNAIQEEKGEVEKIVYSDIFPKTKIKRGDGSMKMWTLEGAYKTYLATAPKSSATGFGADLEIFDDVIKNAEEAMNEDTLDKIWNWFADTMNSRLEVGGKQIFVMTRWAEGDLAGRMINFCKASNKKYSHINYCLEQEDGTLLAGTPLSRERVNDLKALMSDAIFQANYNQKPLDVQGRLYTSLRTYIKRNENESEKELQQRLNDSYASKILPLPNEWENILAYIDTADTGEDYLTCVIFAPYQGDLYVLDVIHSQDGMEVTEPLIAHKLDEWKVMHCLIESNNGGRGFARNVQRLLENEYENSICFIETFTQTKNKISRIITQSNDVMRLIYFPAGWSNDYPTYFDEMTHYVRNGKNKHDDAEDATTGIIEMSRNLGYIDKIEEDETPYRRHLDEDDGWD